MKRGLSFCLFFGFAFVSGSVAQEREPKHLTIAREFVKELKPERNRYNARPTAIVWPDESSKSRPVSNNSVCSSFCATLLLKSYRLSERDLIKIFTEEWPEADEMFEGVTTKREFTVIEKIDDLRPGDFLVFDYQSNKAIPTGHVMLVSGKAIKIERYGKGRIPFQFASEAKVREIKASSVNEWHVLVIDSSKGPHGKEDTRYQSADGGQNDDGVGEGPVRLLADNEGKLLGYTWSTFANSSLWLVEDRLIAMARWKR